MLYTDNDDCRRFLITERPRNVPIEEIKAFRFIHIKGYSPPAKQDENTSGQNSFRIQIEQSRQTEKRGLIEPSFFWPSCPCFCYCLPVVVLVIVIFFCLPENWASFLCHLNAYTFFCWFVSVFVFRPPSRIVFSILFLFPSRTNSEFLTFQVSSHVPVTLLLVQEIRKNPITVIFQLSSYFALHLLEIE